MSLPIRISVRVLLLNEANELLLMAVDDPSTTSMDGRSHGRFWFPIGGAIEPGETVEQTAIREIYEEAGLDAEAISLGPVVWYGEHECILSGKPTYLKENFMVARTDLDRVVLANLTAEEKAVVTDLKWFSLKAIEESSEVIFPVVLPLHLPLILEDNYPKAPIELDLSLDPR